MGPLTQGPGLMGQFGNSITQMLGSLGGGGGGGGIFSTVMSMIPMFHDGTDRPPSGYRAVSPGLFRNAVKHHNGLKGSEYAPAVVQAVRDGSDDILLSWSPRVRQNGGLTNGAETVLDQPYERYEIDVMNGATVVRTTALTDLREWTYSAATHTADFGSLQDSVTFRLYQIGQIVGRGFARVLEA
jgi:hypothetical protein